MVVYGHSGSGKSTLARLIGERLGLPVIELDSIFHQPNWQPTPTDEFRPAVMARLNQHLDGWVCDGNYGPVRDIVLPRADSVVWLRLPFRVVYWRLLKRTIRRALTRELLWGKNRESWRMTFLSRESILLWGVTNWRRHVRRVTQALDEIPHTASVVELRSPQDVESFIARLPPTAGRQ